MPTFSNTPYEADQLTDLYTILTKLPNNTANLIKPKDIRDGVFTLWQNIIYKPTLVTGSTVSYLGLDDATLKTKFYFGKKELAGSQIMSTVLLANDSDFFFFNNKSDSNLSLQDTKISFLAGSTASDYALAPYIQARKITSPSRIDLEIINPSTDGVITIGTATNSVVSILGANFPSIASASVGNALVYLGGSDLGWAATPVTYLSQSFIPLAGTGGSSLVNSILKQVGSSIQVVSPGYISDDTGIFTIDFASGNAIRLTTDGNVGTTPNIYIDQNILTLSASNTHLLMDSSQMYLTSSALNTLFSTISLSSSISTDIISSGSIDISSVTTGVYGTVTNIYANTTLNLSSSNINVYGTATNIYGDTTLSLNSPIIKNYVTSGSENYYLNNTLSTQEYYDKVAELQTIGITTSTVVSFPFNLAVIDGTSTLDCTVRGYAIGGTQSYGAKLFAVFSCVSGVVTKIGATELVQRSTFPPTPSTTSDLNTDGSLIYISVTSGGNIQWSVKYQYQSSTG